MSAPRTPRPGASRRGATVALLSFTTATATAACSRGAPSDAGAPGAVEAGARTSEVASGAPREHAEAAPPLTATAGPATSGEGSLPQPVRDPAEEILARATIRSLRPIDAARGTYAAVLDDGAAVVTLARRAAPMALRRPMAYARLAAALDLAIVPAAALRPVSLTELGSLLGAAPTSSGPASTWLAALAIQNDGTVDALVQRSLAPSFREVSVDGHDVAALQIAAGKLEPGEPQGLLRGWIELVALDYLVANPARRTVWLDAAAGRLAAPDAGLALPPRTDADLTARLLVPLRAVARFPPRLRERLASLDRERVRALLCPGRFEDWLLPPRALVELDERRIALLSLIDARGASAGAD